MKKSKETFKVYEGEVKNMNQRVLELQQVKKKLLGDKKGKKGAESKSVPAKEAEIEKLTSEWNVEKEALNKEREELLAQCKELQDSIKAIKDKAV